MMKSPNDMIWEKHVPNRQPVDADNFDDKSMFPVRYCPTEFQALELQFWVCIYQPTSDLDKFTRTCRGGLVKISSV